METPQTLCQNLQQQKLQTLKQIRNQLAEWQHYREQRQQTKEKYITLIQTTRQTIEELDRKRKQTATTDDKSTKKPKIMGDTCAKAESLSQEPIQPELSSSASIDSQQNVINKAKISRREVLQKLHETARIAQEKQQAAALAISQTLKAAEAKKKKQDQIQVALAKKSQRKILRIKPHTAPMSAVSFPSPASLNITSPADIVSILLRLVTRHLVQHHKGIPLNSLATLFQEYTGHEFSIAMMMIKHPVTSLKGFLEAEKQLFKLVQKDSLTIILNMQLEASSPFEMHYSRLTTLYSAKDLTQWLNIHHHVIDATIKLLRFCFSKENIGKYNSRALKCRLLLSTLLAPELQKRPRALFVPSVQPATKCYPFESLRNIPIHEKQRQKILEANQLSSVLRKSTNGFIVPTEHSSATPYQVHDSPLLKFHSYQLHPSFEQPLLRSGYTYHVDPMRPICRFEVNGVCNKVDCEYQHERDYKTSTYDSLKRLYTYDMDKIGSSIPKQKSDDYYEELAGEFVESYRFKNPGWDPSTQSLTAQSSATERELAHAENISTSYLDKECLKYLNEKMALRSPKLRLLQLPKALHAILSELHPHDFASIDLASELAESKLENEDQAEESKIDSVGLEDLEIHDNDDYIPLSNSAEESTDMAPFEVVEEDTLKLRYYGDDSGEDDSKASKMDIFNISSVITHVLESLDLDADYKEKSFDSTEALSNTKRLQHQLMSLFQLCFRSQANWSGNVGEVMLFLEKALAIKENSKNEALWLLYVCICSSSQRRIDTDAMRAMKNALNKAPASYSLWSYYLENFPSATIQNCAKKHIQAIKELLQMNNATVKSKSAFALVLRLCGVLTNSGHEEDVEIFLLDILKSCGSSLSFQAKSSESHILCDPSLPALIAENLQLEQHLEICIVLLHVLRFHEMPSLENTSDVYVGLSLCRLKWGYGGGRELPVEKNDQLRELLNWALIFYDNINNAEDANGFYLRQCYELILHNYFIFEHTEDNHDIERLEILLEKQRGYVQGRPSLVFLIAQLWTKRNKESAEELLLNFLRPDDWEFMYYFAEYYCQLDQLSSQQKADVITRLDGFFLRSAQSFSDSISTNAQNVITGDFESEIEVQVSPIMSQWSDVLTAYAAKPKVNPYPSVYEPLLVIQYLYFQSGAPLAIKYMDRVLSFSLLKVLSADDRRRLWRKRLFLQQFVVASVTEVQALAEKGIRAMSSSREHLRTLKDAVRKNLSAGIEAAVTASLSIRLKADPWFEYEIVDYVAKLVREVDRGQIYRHFINLNTPLKHYPPLALEASEWLLKRSGRIDEVSAMLSRSLREYPADVDLVRSAVGIELHQIRRGKALRIIERALNSDALSAGVWKELLRIEVLFGERTDIRVKYYALAIAKAGVAIEKTLFGDYWTKTQLWQRIEALRRQSDPVMTGDFSHEQLYIVPSSICHSLASLTVLDLSNNCLTFLPKSLSALRNLVELDVAYNSLFDLPETLAELSKLERLNCAHNHLQHLPFNIGNLRHLQLLNLNANLLSFLPESISLLRTSLTQLYLAFNNVSRRHVDDLIKWKCEINLQGIPNANPLKNKKKKRPNVLLHRNLDPCTICNRGKGTTQYFNTMLLCPNCIVSALRTEL